MRQGLSSVKLDWRLAKRTKMLLGLEKQEKDFQEGRGYASGIRIQGAGGTTMNGPGASSGIRIEQPGGLTTMTMTKGLGESSEIRFEGPGGSTAMANGPGGSTTMANGPGGSKMTTDEPGGKNERNEQKQFGEPTICLLYTSPSPRD